VKTKRARQGRHYEVVLTVGGHEYHYTTWALNRDAAIMLTAMSYALVYGEPQLGSRLGVSVS
jgi:putative NADPH-quinone reductase